MKKWNIVLKILGICILIEGSIDIRNLQISPCYNNINYPITINNVQAHIINKKIKVYGLLNTTDDLTSPIQSAITIKRDTFGVWIPIPCIEQEGSCTYTDLCKYGYPANKECPQNFKKNNVPCRCPIKKGSYSLPPEFSPISRKNSITTGKYKGTVTIKDSESMLGCFNFYFELYDKNYVDN